MDNPDRLPHLARLAEAHEPDLIRAEIEAKVAEWAKPKRLPSGWWLLPALIVAAALWLGFFKLIGVL